MVKRVLVYGIQSMFAFTLVLLAYHAQSIDVHSEYFFLFALILIFMLLPAVDNLNTNVKKMFRKSISPDAYIDTIDSIIQLNSIDELLNSQFNQILHLLGLSEGYMIFHNRERDEYSIFLKSLDPNIFTKTGSLEFDNVLLKVINSAEDIIFKSKINPQLQLERDLIQVMDSYKAEIIIPMFYSDIFTGAMLLGSRNSRYSSEEISALKIFASKIASLSMNSMFWRDLARKRELEKERTMELRVQRSFLSREKLETEKCQVSVFFNMNTVLFDRFHTLFSYNKTVYFISYRTTPEDRSTLIFLPSLAVLIETFVTSGIPIAESVEKAKHYVLGKHMFDIPPNIFACSITAEGLLEFTNETQIEPFLFKGRSLIYPAAPAPLADGDIFIYTNNHIKRVFIEYSIEVADILYQFAHLSTDEIKEKILAFLNSINIIRENSFFSLFKYRKTR